jgi:hypothetical protein
MSNQVLLDYYTLMEKRATLQMVALAEGIEKQSAEECLEYFRGWRMHYTVLCNP